jgi:hypothetical protein
VATWSFSRNFHISYLTVTVHFLMFFWPCIMN